MSRLLEFRHILDSMKRAWRRKKKTALVMLIDANGSAYRLPGTKMMMTADGEMVGTISGGCLERDVFSYTEKALKEETPLTINYDLSKNDIWGLGIGCNGSLEILVLPVPEADPFWQSVEKYLHQEEDFTFILEIPTGAKAIVGKNGQLVTGERLLPAEVYNQAVSGIMSQRRAKIIEWSGRRFVSDVVRPSQRLIVAGAGKDAIPVVALAAKADFSVTVIDPRGEFNHERFFPSAAHLVQHPESIDPEAVGGAWWLIMNHLQTRDEAALGLALKSNPKYIGVLGPVSRTKEILQNLGADQEVFDRIHSPVGLDIGAETMAEVAISIVSELMMVRSLSSGTSLKGKLKIHA